MNAFDNVEVLENFIIFKFEDLVDRNNRNAFHETTQGGIILRSDFDRSAREPRWATVIGVGPKVCKDIQKGTRILIEALKWTKESTYQNETFARTEDTYVLAIED